MSTARSLELLSLLQRPRTWSATELADRLGTSPRTIRRDVEQLRQLGYPVEATLGAAGGYRLVAGGAMPPLVLDDDEAVAIVVGLRTAAAQVVAGIDEASVRALAKVLQVLPSRLRGRVGALAALDSTQLADDLPTVDPDDLARLAAAAEGNERVRFGYTAADGARRERRVEPHGVVALGRRWYLVGYDVDRDDWRTFRVDRLDGVEPLGGRGGPRRLPAATAAEYVRATMLDRAPMYEAVVTVDASLAVARARLGDAAAAIEPLDGDRCRFRSRPETAEWLAARLGASGCDFVVEEPPELIAQLRVLAARLRRAAEPR